MFNNFKSSINESIKIKKNLLRKQNFLKVKKIIEIMYECILKNNKIYICGNGGSAADAQHLSTEFLVRLNPTINRPAFPIIDLASNSTFLTAVGNDIGFDNIFKRNLEAMACPNDLLITLTTSGNSKNIYKVLKYASKKKIKSICFLGKDGGKCKGLANHELIIKSKNVARIQEAHMFLGHYILNEVEKKLLSIIK